MKLLVFSSATLALLLGVGLFSPRGARAELAPVKTYTTADGLPRDQANQIKRDSHGFLWFCTNDGLSRFDGYSFTNYTTDDGLPHRVVNDLLETRSGAIWVATGNGLARFNPKGRRNHADSIGATAAPMFVSRKSVDAMSDIVWMTNPKKDNLSDLTQRMRRFAGDTLVGRNIEPRFSAPETEFDIKLNADLRREVFLIFKEAINNAARHAGCAVVEVALLIDEGAIRLKVSDNGCGLDPSRVNEGQGLVSMGLRAERLDGKLSVTSQPGAGTTVTLNAPLSRR